MNKLEAYVFRQALGPLLAVLGALSAVAILTQGLSQLDIIVNNRQSGLAFAWVTLLTIPQLISMILPLAVFFAVAYAINRMHTESETVVAYAAGVSPTRLAKPIFILSVLAALLHLCVTTLIQPASYREMRETIHAVRADVASSLVREGAFTFPADNLTLYARSRGARGEMRDVMIHDARPREPLTYTAREGAIAMIDGKPAMVMRAGQIQRQRDDGRLEVLDFDQYVVQLGEFFTATDEFILKPSDRFLSELFFPDLTNFFDQRNIDRFLAEGHGRLSAPLLNPALALIAMAALLGGDFSRRGYLRRLGAAAILAVIVRVLALGVQSSAIDDPELNPLQYALPVLVMIAAGWALMSAHPRRPPKRAMGVSMQPAE
ncbi:MAG: LptF/LptG family permease [Alphaproteobacteria bacterium]|nr:LptF/LptG family permease [Alphaproteobacteria bacterium]